MVGSPQHPTDHICKRNASGWQNEIGNLAVKEGFREIEESDVRDASIIQLSR